VCRTNSSQQHPCIGCGSRHTVLAIECRMWLSRVVRSDTNGAERQVLVPSSAWQQILSRRKPVLCRAACMHLNIAHLCRHSQLASVYATHHLHECGAAQAAHSPLCRCATCLHDRQSQHTDTRVGRIKNSGAHQSAARATGQSQTMLPPPQP
jgi:hypothetical protein